MGRCCSQNVTRTVCYGEQLLMLVDSAMLAQMILTDTNAEYAHTFN